METLPRLDSEWRVPYRWDDLDVFTQIDLQRELDDPPLPDSQKPHKLKELGATCIVRDEGRQIRVDLDRRQDKVYEYDAPMREEGDIQGFSEDSRRRLRRTFDRLRRDAPCVFVTLSYHRKDPSCEEAKEDLHAFVQALRRRYEDVRCSVIWRMEWQARGVPHFHLLIFGIEWEHRDVYKRIWHRITGEREADRKHLFSPLRSERWGKDVKIHTWRCPGGHRVSEVHPGCPHRGMGAWVEDMASEVDEEKVRNYVAKYHCKSDSHAPPEGAWQGRHWGIRMREHLPVAPVTSRHRISYRLGQALIRHCLDTWGVDYDAIPTSLHISAERPGERLTELLTEASKRAVR